MGLRLLVQPPQCALASVRLSGSARPVLGGGFSALEAAPPGEDVHRGSAPSAGAARLSVWTGSAPVALVGRLPRPRARPPGCGVALVPKLCLWTL